MKLCVIRGDGIGPEVIEAALQVLHELAPEVTSTEVQAGWDTFQQSGSALPEATLATARESHAILFGAVASPSHPVPGYRSPIVGIRRALELYANIRPVISQSPPRAEQSGEFEKPEAGNVDLVIVRENTEGLYAGRERLEEDGQTAIAERVITRAGSERIVRTAFELAQERAVVRGQHAETAPRLPRVSVVHKANVLRVSDGLFREVALQVAKTYQHIAVDELLVDTAAMHLAQNPRRFDVVVTSNLYGDILSDVACIHGGGLGLASSANLGQRQALFEPVHGAAPDIVGRGIANPLAALGCVAMLLEWAGRQDLIGKRWATMRRSAALRQAIAETLRNGPTTPDLGGQATTQEVTSAVLERLSATI
jgi:homoisocitrate dehydrogenase